MRMPDRQQIIEFSVDKCQQLRFKGTYFVFVDYSRPANQHRIFVVNVRDKSIYYEGHTSHGTRSGAKNGLNLKFSNIHSSHMSSKGLFRIGETYWSSKFKGLSVRLDGLSTGVNDNARARAIVMHPSSYLSETYIRRNKYPGRSWGCFVLDPVVSEDIINKVKNGSYLYVNAI